MVSLYDVKEFTGTSDEDGIFVSATVITETRKFDVQPIQWASREAANRVEIMVGGIKYIPTYYGFVDKEAKVTATNYITNNSGVSNLLVLRTYELEDHLELDLVEAESRG